MLWKLVKSGEKSPLSAAGLALLFHIRFALQEYEAKTKTPEVNPHPKLAWIKNEGTFGRGVPIGQAAEP
jgi:hypothetical protein